MEFQLQSPSLRAYFFATAALLVAAPQPAASQPISLPSSVQEPGSLKRTRVPMPVNLESYITDRNWAIALGKALFWDQQAGSDGLACASCHFQAGADSRAKNQLSPGLLNVVGPPVAHTFNKTALNRNMASGGGPNYTLRRDDFPFHQVADVNNRNSAVTFDTDDVASSQGVFRRDFVSTDLVKKKAESCRVEASEFAIRSFSKSAALSNLVVRQVEPRNTPTTINAVFYFRNFWDGRANNIFNGRNPFGPRDATAGVDPLNSVMAMDAAGNLVPEKISLADASLASQAVGPALSDMEMSCRGRVFEQLGRKLLALQPLAHQAVDTTDSALGAYATKKTGLSVSYKQMIQRAFHPRFWNSSRTTQDGYSQVEKNFSFFWGMSIMLYEATLVSDDAPFDRYKDGVTGAMTEQQIRGYQLFLTKGKCVACHKGGEFTSAGTASAHSRNEGTLVERMRMGDSQQAIYDTGFYNIGVRPSGEDIGLGGVDPFGVPLSWSRQAKLAALSMSNSIPQVGPDLFKVDTCKSEASPCTPIAQNERDAVDGSFKTPTLRNVELTGPYFHNGGQATLEQVISFYNRGGDSRDLAHGDTTGFSLNPSNRAPDIERLNLSSSEQADLVAFLKALTDDRVRWEKAPFDHPSLRIPDGHPKDETFAVPEGISGKAKDEWVTLPAVGAAGRTGKRLGPLTPFHSQLK